MSSFVIPHHPRNLHYPVPSLSRRHTMEMTLHFPVTLTSTFLITLVWGISPHQLRFGLDPAHSADSADSAYSAYSVPQVMRAHKNLHEHKRQNRQNRQNRRNRRNRQNRRTHVTKFSHSGFILSCKIFTIRSHAVTQCRTQPPCRMS